MSVHRNLNLNSLFHRRAENVKTFCSKFQSIIYHNLDNLSRNVCTLSH